MAERKRHRGWRVLWLTSLGLVAVILVLLLVFQRSTTSELEAQIAIAKSLGIPTTAADMLPKPPVPDSENAAPLYKVASSLFKSAYYQPGSPGDPTYRKEVQDHWQANEKALHLFFQATSKPHCDFGPEDETLKSFRAIAVLDFVSLVGSKSEILIHDGQVHNALQLLLRVAAFSKHLSENPSFLNLLYRLMTTGVIDPQFPAATREGVAERL